jgi:hypothetical protein
MTYQCLDKITGFLMLYTCGCLKVILGSIVGFPAQWHLFPSSFGISSRQLCGGAWQMKG